MPVTELTATERERIFAKAALFAPPANVLPDGRRDLVGLSREELAAEMAEIGEKPFRAKQLWHWIYHQGVTDFAAMSTIAKPLQEKLARAFRHRPAGGGGRPAQDETRKFLFRFRDHEAVDSLHPGSGGRSRRRLHLLAGRLHPLLPVLPYRHAAPGAQFVAAEIVGQFMAARDAYGEWPSPKGETPRLLSTIVLMGMGEPLYNYENVAKAMKIIMDGEGIALSRRRITLSTSGVVPMMDQAGEELGVNLAVSLHAVRDDLRDELVPLNRKYPIAELIAACRRYPGGIQCAAHHLRIRDAQGHQRSRGRCAGAGETHRRAAGEGEPDPVQPLAGQQIRNQQPGGDPQIRRYRDECRLRLAGAHTARPGHSGGVRAVEIRGAAGCVGKASKRYFL